jgi:hypothetical protein
LRVYVTRWFGKFARREQLSTNRMCEAAKRAGLGLVDADLGGGLIKQRIARSGAGRSSGYRVLIALRTADRAIFLYGFAKSERDNIGPDDLADLKRTAAVFLGFGIDELAYAVEAGELREIGCHG